MLFEPLEDVLRDSTRPCFFFGSTPPRVGSTEENAKISCQKFASRSAVLATDGFIIYDIQEEEGRTTMERPFPFMKTLDSAWYASLFLEVTGKQCLVYKCVSEDSLESFDTWITNAHDKFCHSTFVLVGAASSSVRHSGPSLGQAMNHVAAKSGVSFGCVCIAERHSSKGNENVNMVRKIESGADWFVTQGIYAAGPITRYDAM